MEIMTKLNIKKIIKQYKDWNFISIKMESKMNTQP